ncbi:RNA 2',3'-cyclic phosphodiesterase [Desulfonatronum lacustre]|uniref:RNA 2',3'-cyclic phosphodiesterase n=1 Tax=Desulfonatronum lacustre TaxID=66849 RepID=UPI00048DD567|nr:RNA 2',3'-cyclic phosphodiesterase [Desulfonatronum lacustre]SMP45522.1 2'-5' RNA ligase [Desulfonatronum zhilinae]
MRCFIGLPLPGDYQRLLAGVITEWKPVLGACASWTKPENWHLTLKFLGETDQGHVARLSEFFGGGTGEAFVLQGRGGGFFPDPRKPRVLWVGLGKGANRTRRLAARIEEVCVELGFAREERLFRPHLTIARLKQPRKDHRGEACRSSRESRQSSASPWGEVLRFVETISWPEITVDRMVLWESRLSAEGPNYRPLAEWRLATGAFG